MDTNSDEVKVWLDKLERYCAYQERCISDVKTKMYNLKIPKEEMSFFLDKLIEDKFIDELRYARAFLRAKTNFKKDGLEKIRFALMQKGIPAATIAEVFEDLDRDLYDENLKALIDKKWPSLYQKNEKQEAKAKLIRFLLSKGYKYDDFKNLLK